MNCASTGSFREGAMNCTPTLNSSYYTSLWAIFTCLETGAA